MSAWKHHSAFAAACAPCQWTGLPGSSRAEQPRHCGSMRHREQVRPQPSSTPSRPRNDSGRSGESSATRVCASRRLCTGSTISCCRPESKTWTRCSGRDHDSKQSSPFCSTYSPCIRWPSFSMIFIISQSAKMKIPRCHSRISSQPARVLRKAPLECSSSLLLSILRREPR